MIKATLFTFPRPLTVLGQAGGSVIVAILDNTVHRKCQHGATETITQGSPTSRHNFTPSIRPVHSQSRFQKQTRTHITSKKKAQSSQYKIWIERSKKNRHKKCICLVNSGKYRGNSWRLVWRCYPSHPFALIYPPPKSHFVRELLTRSCAYWASPASRAATVETTVVTDVAVPPEAEVSAAGGGIMFCVKMPRFARMLVRLSSVVGRTGIDHGSRCRVSAKGIKRRHGQESRGMEPT